MTQTALNIDPARSVVLIEDFQQRIITNVASEPEAVVRNAARALEGARAAGIPVIYVVHRGGPFAEYAPDVELHEGVAPAEGEQGNYQDETGTVFHDLAGRGPADDGQGYAHRHGRGHERVRPLHSALGS